MGNASKMEDISPVCHPSMPQADEYARWGLGGGLDAPRSEATGRGGRVTTQRLGCRAQPFLPL